MEHELEKTHTIHHSLYEDIRDRLNNEIKNWMFDNIVGHVSWNDKSMHEAILFIGKNMAEGKDISTELKAEMTEDGINFNIVPKVLE